MVETDVVIESVGISLEGPTLRSTRDAPYRSQLDQRLVVVRDL